MAFIMRFRDPRPLFRILLLTATLLFLDAALRGHAGLITSICIAKSKGQGCPVYRPNQPSICGLISICTSKGLPQKGLGEVCDNCGPLPANGRPLKKCDYPSGKCIVNNGEGSPCNPPEAPGPTKLCGSAPGTACRAVIGQKGKYRCCRTTCPPGLCGAYLNAATFWTNQCGERFKCKGWC